MPFVPLNPIPLKDRVSLVFLQYGQLDVIDGAFVLVDQNGVRTHIPIGSVACLMLEPGTRESPMPRSSWQRPLELCWSGWERRAFACMPLDNREAPAVIVCSIRPSWLWMKICG